MSGRLCENEVHALGGRLVRSVHSTNPDRSQSWSLAFCDGNVGNESHSVACQKSLPLFWMAELMLITFTAYRNTADVWQSSVAWCSDALQKIRGSLWGLCLSVVFILFCFLGGRKSELFLPRFRMFTAEKLGFECSPSFFFCLFPHFKWQIVNVS